MNESDLTRRLLGIVNASAYRPVKPRVLAKMLELTADERVELKRTIKKLVKSGQLVFGANHLVQSGTKPTKDERIGVFRRAAGGYGFVRPQGTSRSAGRDEDVFIPATSTRDAASGDLVRVRVKRRGVREGRSRLAGEIVAIVKRGTSQYVGTYEARPNGTGLVHIDGTDFGGPIRVGDPGAKAVETDDKVVVEIVRYPTSERPGEAVITEVLGASGEPGVDTLTVMRQYMLPDRFPEDVLEAAREVASQFDGTLTNGRRDLTHLITVTIDPVDARDFDDAISLERLENGHWRLGVHIADVSHFVQPNTALDREARDRATSVYLPDRVIPMLPEVISNHLASLQPNEVRFTKTAFIEYTAEGVRVATDFCTGAIRSRRRFSYEEIDQFLVDKMSWHIRLGPEVFRLVEDMYRLAMILRRRRLDRGSIELNRPEIKIQLDRQGRVTGAAPVPRTESHQIIEEFMLAANESVAERLKDEEVAFLRRIHESPDPIKMDSLTAFVRELGIDCDHLESRFETKRVLALVVGEPLEAAVHYAVLRAMQKAVYSPEDIGHYALAFQDYCHFTSPIRRYPDLTIHRLMESIFQGRRPAGDMSQLAALGEHCSQREQRAEAAERDLVKLKLLHYLSDKVGQVMDAVITGAEEFGLFAQGLELPAEGLIPVRSLQDDHYRYDPDQHAMVGFREGNLLRLGDLVRVQIARVDLQRRELDFLLLQRLPRLGKATDASERGAEKRAPGKRSRSEDGGRRPGEKGTRGTSKTGEKASRSGGKRGRSSESRNASRADGGKKKRKRKG